MVVGSTGCTSKLPTVAKQQCLLVHSTHVANCCLMCSLSLEEVTNEVEPVFVDAVVLWCLHRLALVQQFGVCLKPGAA